MGTLEFSGGSNKTNTASEAGCNSGGSEEAGDDEVGTLNESDLFLPSAQTEEEKKAKRTWS